MTTLSPAASPGKAGGGRSCRRPDRRLVCSEIAGVLVMTAGKSALTSWLDPLACELGPGWRAYRFAKFIAGRKPGSPRMTAATGGMTYAELAAFLRREGYTPGVPTGLPACAPEG